jgi:hypothetical protein
MIQGFKQFINESFNDQRPLSVHESINEPFSEFISTAQERLDTFTSRIGKLLHDMDVAIESIQGELWDIIVGEPNIKVDKNLSDITVEFHTSAPNNDEAWAADESLALDIEIRMRDLLDERNDVQVEIASNPDEDGNCVIVLHIYVIDEDNFGEYTDALNKLGEE